MTPISIRLCNDEHYGYLLTVLKGVKVDGTIEVSIKLVKNKRSNAQNRLMWDWHTELATNAGETKEEAHARFKWRHCRPLLLQNHDDDGSIARACDIIATLDVSDQRAAMKLADGVLSTTDLNVAEMSSALNEYDMTQARRGFVFTKRGYYDEAMGR
jgi:hypothetical protein